jgi:hypothetical protein
MNGQKSSTDIRKTDIPFIDGPVAASPSPINNVLTIAEIATELRCSKAHVFNIIHGKVPGLPPLPVLRIGRRLLVRYEALQRWMAWIEGRESEIQRGSGFFLPSDDDMESMSRSMSA